MGFFDSLDISASALSAQRLRMDVISENMANVNTTRAKDGKPYQRKTVMFEERNDVPSFLQQFDNAISKSVQGKGVRVSRVVTDDTPGSLVYEPNHPDAVDGYVRMPNVNVVEEMVNMISASRAYEANITALSTSKTISAKTLEISK